MIEGHCCNFAQNPNKNTPPSLKNKQTRRHSSQTSQKQKHLLRLLPLQLRWPVARWPSAAVMGDIVALSHSPTRLLTVSHHFLRVSSSPPFFFFFSGEPMVLTARMGKSFNLFSVSQAMLSF